MSKLHVHREYQHTTSFVLFHHFRLLLEICFKNNITQISVMYLKISGWTNALSSYKREISQVINTLDSLQTNPHTTPSPFPTPASARISASSQELAIISVLSLSFRKTVYNTSIYEIWASFAFLREISYCICTYMYNIKLTLAGILFHVKNDINIQQRHMTYVQVHTYI